MTDRLLVALHVPQELLPLSGSHAVVAGNGPSKAHSTSTTPQGYGPPMPVDGTPLTRLVSATLYNQSPTSSNDPNSHGSSNRTEYDLVALPLTNRNWQERWESMCVSITSQSQFDLQAQTGNKLQSQQGQSVAEEAERWRGGGAFHRHQVNVTRSEETGSLVAFASDWLELDSPDEGLRFDSELALRQEVTYASYLSLTTIIVAPPRAEFADFLPDYARAINGALASSWHINVSVASGRSSTPVGSWASAQDDCQTWEWWNTIRSMCGYSPRLSICLDLSSALPPAQFLGRWAAEPVKHIFLPCSTFIPNAKAYPVLTKSLQAFLKRCFRFNPTVILSGTQKGLHAMGGPLAYVQYVRHLHRKAAPLDPVEQYAQGYMDHLQLPLQPLMDNLEGETYEGFEKDPVKYRQYEEAVYQALLDRPERMPVTIFVVGAGRGPLVAGCLRAAERSRRKIIITAVEKNPSAYVILQERAALEWGSSVKLVFSDMRSFHPREQADIIVSELLGSFGDNELSPECLDGVMRCLKREFGAKVTRVGIPTEVPGVDAPIADGISIPSSYTSYLAPITTSKLHAEVTRPVPLGTSSTSADYKPAESPYVVMFSAFHILSASTGQEGGERVQECWSFVHPNPRIIFGQDGLPLTNSHNTRSAHLSFHIPYSGVCHGFAGYFEATLYKNVGLSIHPERAAGDMLSWFPIFFPLMDPIYLPASSSIDVQMWRMTDSSKRKVWFEWAASAYITIPSPITTPSPNPNTTTVTTASATGGGARTSYDPRTTWMAMPSPLMDDGIFHSAPSPMIGSTPHLTNGTSPTDRRDSGRMPNAPDEEGSNQQSHASMSMVMNRVLINQSKLHNPGGRTSHIGV
ncbi:BZ3500_MvSof-1268-A1-R1_Chr3-2g06233 [Microbotryum saponariae]|uniref:BZ3500_MvSof-1268-A1-R1_Chr3-2g06233 protein n=1 Tax=Microbotryum saponariae TaxID=289078 RepID=A0A2X0KYL8_9BASI|nr:BZ3500_MvSof-1268-A1-R1_Chr3-2g06233 [Microbotryum saponariae]